MQAALHASTRATCPRRHVGAVLVRDRAMIATGYNGSIRGLPHCDAPGIGCLMIDEHCERTVHAEANAIAAAARSGVSTSSSTAYVTAYPCFGCFKLLANAGIERIVYGSPYADRAGLDVVRESAAECRIELVELLGIVPSSPSTRATLVASDSRTV